MLALSLIAVTVTVAIFAWAQLAHVFAHNNPSRSAGNVVVATVLLAGLASASVAAAFSPEELEGSDSNEVSSACAFYRANAQGQLTVAANVVDRITRRASFSTNEVRTVVSDATAAVSVVALNPASAAVLAEELSAAQEVLAKISYQINTSYPTSDAAFELEMASKALADRCGVSVS